MQMRRSRAGIEDLLVHHPDPSGFAVFTAHAQNQPAGAGASFSYQGSSLAPAHSSPEGRGEGGDAALEPPSAGGLELVAGARFSSLVLGACLKPKFDSDA